MELTDVLCILNLAGLAAVAVLLVLLLRRRTDGVSAEELHKTEEKLTESLRRETAEAEGALRREMADSRRETSTAVQTSVSELGKSLRESQKDSAEAQRQQLAGMEATLDKRVNALTDALSTQIAAMTDALDKQVKTLTDTLNKQVGALKDSVGQQMTTLTEAQNRQMDALSDGQKIRLEEVGKQVSLMAQNSTAAQEQMRQTLEAQLSALRTQNTQQLEKMRETVDEKLQKTLDERISQSFKLVNDRLGEVYQGLGEMKTLAVGVGDLKKVLSGVKTRGIVGEVQLGAIIEDMLTPDQYAKNIVTRKGSRDPVEYAVKLPGTADEPVYLPVDAKFPGDTYARLMDAYESGDADAVKAAQAQLTEIIRREAKDIHDKYIDVPHTTEFGILFLPTEGLYAEAVRLELPEKLRKDYQISVTGPTTLAALLNSLRLGFRTLAVQKKSAEVWQVLGAVKTEFAKFGDALKTAQERIQKAGEDLDKLVGTRTKQINRRLKDVEKATEEEALTLLPEGAPIDGDDS
jgi:DNA recombination protein RmuC